MSVSTALLERPAAHIEIDYINNEASNEISRLLLHAANCVDLDEANAIDLVKRASTLLRPFADKSSANREQVAVGGLAPWQVRRLNIYVEEHISRQISIEELAQLANLSTSYFSAAFKASYGTSPHNYIISQRVEQAKHLMLHGTAPLCEIALDCGLSDQAHLSRIFRRLTGTTPSAWRRYRRSLAQVVPFPLR